ncbi:MAG: hypothetical protein WA960_22475 [Tunicatimonas sp.]
MMVLRKHLLCIGAGLLASVAIGSGVSLRAQDSNGTLALLSPASVTPSLSPRVAADKPDSYFVLPPCPVNQYTTGEIIAVPRDIPSPVTNATLKKGETPTGTTLFPNGCLVVIDPSQLSVGTYRFVVETADEAGTTESHSLTVKLKPSGKEDIDAMYSVRQPKPIDRYLKGDVLATSQDRDGAILRAELVKGTLPAGTSLTKEGVVTVNDPTQLVAGQYAAWIATEDSNGGTTLFIITLTLQ